MKKTNKETKDCIIKRLKNEKKYCHDMVDYYSSSNDYKNMVKYSNKADAFAKAIMIVEEEM